MSGKRIAALIAGGIALVIVLNLLAAGLDDAVGGNEPQGESGSSYATAAPGLAAYVKLLAEYDHRVSRLRDDLSNSTLPPDSTLVIVEPGPMSSDDTDAITRALDIGTRVVLAGASTSDARRILAGAPALTGGSEVFDEVDIGSVERVTTNGDVAYDGSGDMRALARDGDMVLAVSAPVGAGELILIADPSPLGNSLLGEADNAAFALEIVSPSRDVVFAEGFHGASRGSGLGALPSGWKIALLGLGLAVLLFAWSHARRLGPPDRPHRELPPARAEYIAAMAAALERTREPGAALHDLAQAARDRAESDAIALSDQDQTTLTTPPTTESDVLAVGRVAARVIRGDIDERNTP